MGRVARIEAQLAATQQRTHIGSWEWDLRTGSVLWSDELYRIYGLGPRSCAVTLEAFLAKVHPDDRAHVQSAVARAVETGEPFAYTERILRPDGSVRELDTQGEVERDAHGEVIALLGTCRDVTEERERDETIRLYADIVKNVQIGLTVWKVDDPGDIDHIRLVAFNPAAETIAGVDRSSAIGRTLAEIVPYAKGGELESLLAEVARDGRIAARSVERSRDPRRPMRALAMKGFPLPGRRVGVALEEITASVRARLFQEAEQRTLERIASGAPLAETLEAIVVLIEEHAPATVASILLLDPDGKRLRHGAAPSLPAGYVRAIDGAAIGPAAGSCGTAAFERKPVYAADLLTDPRWRDYSELARAYGLPPACWSTPIFARDEHVVGTFALYFRDAREPTAADAALVERATHLARIAIEGKQLEEQLRNLSARAESVREEERTGIAREIHDQLGQALTGLKMELAWIARHELGREELGEKLRELAKVTDGILDEVRRISAELRPGVLDELGLLAAIEWQSREFERRTGTKCVVRSNLGDAPIERDVATAVFRIFQEALTNVARHAHASEVQVHLNDDGASLALDVEDDGAGISDDALRSPRSLGLLGIRERARRLGGEVQVTALTPHGTRVALSVPLDATSATPRGAS